MAKGELIDKIKERDLTQDYRRYNYVPWGSESPNSPSEPGACACKLDI